MGRATVSGVVAIATTTVGGALGLVVLARLDRTAGSGAEAGGVATALTPLTTTGAGAAASSVAAVPSAAGTATAGAAATPGAVDGTGAAGTSVVTPLAGGDFVGVALALLAAAVVVGGLVVLLVALADRVLADSPDGSTMGRRPTTTTRVVSAVGAPAGGSAPAGGAAPAGDTTPVAASRAAPPSDPPGTLIHSGVDQPSAPVPPHRDA
jgi:hypothetical protein